VTCGEGAEGALTSADACGHLTAADIGDGARVPQSCPSARQSVRPIFSRSQRKRTSPRRTLSCQDALSTVRARVARRRLVAVSCAVNDVVAIRQAAVWRLMLPGCAGHEYCHDDQHRERYQEVHQQVPALEHGDMIADLPRGIPLQVRLSSEWAARAAVAAPAWKRCREAVRRRTRTDLLVSCSVVALGCPPVTPPDSGIGHATGTCGPHPGKVCAVKPGQ
jgi:hypothetical protein